MNKIFLIIRREYLSRVKKKSFILMTVLGPILMVSILVVPILLAQKSSRKQMVEVIDDSKLFTYTSNVDGSYKSLIPGNEMVQFDAIESTIQSARAGFFKTSYDAIIWVNKDVLNGGAKGITLYYKEQLSNNALDYIQYKLSEMLYNTMLANNHVNIDFIKDAKDKSTFTLLTMQVDENGQDKKVNTGLYMGIGWMSAAMIYFFIFLYGVQVMRGVMEEKTSRIVEVILSSVKPFQLMMGKIVGVALVGLTQFLLWVILTSALYSFVGATFLKNIEMKQVQQKTQVVQIGEKLDVHNMQGSARPDEMMKIWNDFQTVDVTEILLCFVFYFLAGYFMYSALFAAVGSAVDSETDTQQFMMPITLPLVFSFVISQTVMQDPQGSLAFWFSMIPLTSPVVMMVRLPFGVPIWQVLLSMSLLIIGFICTTWIAGRIYRTGILMYGKKVSWKELGKWLFYKG
ncbi:MAG: ABC transporter permease [Bacteroidia bacterium]